MPESFPLHEARCCQCVIRCRSFSHCVSFPGAKRTSHVYFVRCTLYICPANPSIPSASLRAETVTSMQLATNISKHHQGPAGQTRLAVVAEGLSFSSQINNVDLVAAGDQTDGSSTPWSTQRVSIGCAALLPCPRGPMIGEFDSDPR